MILRHYQTPLCLLILLMALPITLWGQGDTSTRTVFPSDSLERYQDSVLSSAFIALAADSTLVVEYEKIAAIYKARRKFTLELATTSRLIRINPYSPVGNFIQGDALLDNSLVDSAIVHLYRSLTLEPTFVRARTTLADAYKMKKAYDTALWMLDTAIAQNPRYAQAHSQRAEILTQLGRDTEAITSYRTASELLPSSFAIWMTLSRAYLKVRSYEDAIETLAYARSLNPNSADALYLYAESNYNGDQRDEAIKAYEEFALQFPLDRRALDAERLARRLRDAAP